MSNRPSAQQVVLTSFFVDLSDILLNVVVAILSGSVVMLSQALQGTADLLTSGLLLVGTQQARRRATAEYRFGFGRELFFWTLIAGVSMFAVTGILSVSFGVQRVLTPQPIEQLGLSQFILFIGVITNGYALSLSYRRLTNPKTTERQLWRRWHRSTLVETKTTLALDLMGTIASILGLIALGSYWLSGSLIYDGLGSIAIGLMTMGFSFALILNAKSLLIGRSASTETIAEIRAALHEMPNIESIGSIHTLYIGTEQLLANIDVRAARHLTTSQLEQLVDQMKQRIHTRVPSVRHAQIELAA